MMPNHSLNRTFCGSPRLGYKILAQTLPAAKCRLAQTLGLTTNAPPRSTKVDSFVNGVEPFRPRANDGKEIDATELAFCATSCLH